MKSSVNPFCYADLTPAGHIVWNDVEGELVLFDSRDDRYHALNEVGSHVWRNIAHGCALSLVINDLCDQYQQDEAIIRADVQHFLAEALDKGLLQLKAAPL